MKGKKISLKWRIFAAFSAILFIVLALLWVCQTVFLNSFYKQVRVYHAQSAAQQVADHLSDEELGYTVAELANRHDVNIRVLNNQFSTICEAFNHERNAFFSNIPDSELYFFSEEAEANDGTYSEFFQGLSKGNSSGNGKQDKQIISYIIAKAVADNEGGNTTVIVYADITPVDSVITTLRVILIVVTVITVLLVLLTALLLSAGLSKPIKQLSEQAKILATGDYQVEFHASSLKEIDELAQSLNYAKTQLGKIDTLQKELIANISHDLRTPLTLISGYAEVMRDIPGEVTDENLQVIIDESNRLSDLVNDVLDVSRFNAEGGQIQLQPLDLVACIEEIIPRYNKLVENRHYTICFENNADPTALVSADRTRILQVLYNLVNNAVTYTGEDKTVHITLEKSDGAYTVHIMDSGEGIEEDKLPYIWDRYYKVDKNHRRAQMGSGLGLSIVKQILDAHGATYGVNSALGKGSDFWFCLPAIEES